MNRPMSLFGLFAAICLFPVLPNVAAAAQAAPSASFAVDLKNGTVEIRGLDHLLQVSLKSPAFVLDDREIPGGELPVGTTGTLTDGKTLEISYAPVPVGDSARLELRVSLRWSAAESVLRKWAAFRSVGAKEGKLLKEVILDRIAVDGRPAWTHGTRKADRQIIPSPQSQPAFLPGVFLGIEFPIASVRVESGQVVLAHRPAVRLQPERWYQSRAAVYGIAPAEGEVRAFEQYIASHRPKPHGIHIDYNSWWTSPAPYYSEKDILDLMKVFEEKLYKARGVAFDSFCIDMGWSEPKSIWEIDRKSFPQGFSRLQAAAAKMQSRLGLWISPSSYYPTALDIDWAKAHGFESFPSPPYRLMCLGGPRYAGQFKTRLANLVAGYGIRQLKLDGYCVECPATDHGHQPGAGSSEAIAEGVVAAMDAAHRADPTVWIETTCFGVNPSPWWLFHANSVIGTFGDDAPRGRVPSPVYRESYTTARDFYNLQGAALLPVPIAAQEVLGIIHQTPEPFLNDAVTVVLRGHEFLPVYLNPKFMNDARWDALSQVLKWARHNAAILGETVLLLPAAWQHGEVPRFGHGEAMPREPYGYAHIKQGAGLVALRNPWIAPQSYRLKLDESLGFTPAGAKNLSAVSLYPEPRLYGENLKFGDTLDVALAPYETVVLSIDSLTKTPDVPRAADAVRRHLVISGRKHQLQRRAASESRPAETPSQPAPPAAAAVRLTCSAQVRATAPHAELLLLCEGKKGLAAPVGRLTVDGRETATEAISSDAGWSATGASPLERWIFFRAPLAAGEHAVSLDYALGGGSTRVSVWVLATKPGGVSAYPNSLPQPETVSLDGVAVLDVVEVK
jgi:hypothetical protein